jgi:hypothetical protein
MNKLVVLEAGVSRRGLAESIGVDKDDVGFQYGILRTILDVRLGGGSREQISLTAWTVSAKGVGPCGWRARGWFDA